MLTRTITQGETLVIRYTLNSEGTPVDADETWSCAMRVTSGGSPGGATAMDAVITYDDGVIVATINTAGLSAGIYYYDLRFTAPASTPVWVGGTRLTLSAKSSPAS